MNNPLVRPQLSFYAEEAGEFMDSMRHGDCWRAADPQLACPMARRKNGNLIQDYYAYEPALAEVSSGEVLLVVPFCFYNVRGKEGLYADVRALSYDANEGEGSWIIGPCTVSIPLEGFIRSHPEIQGNPGLYEKLIPAPLTCISCKSVMLR